MSELKEHRFITTDELFHDANAGALYYDKSEADKVIAELEETLKNSRNARKYWRNEYLIEYKECRHSKYKRCLAMAWWCRLHDEFTQSESERLGLPQRAIFMEYRRKAMWWNKWHKRWLELAEKFKPNSTAQ